MEAVVWDYASGPGGGQLFLMGEVTLESCVGSDPPLQGYLAHKKTAL